MGAAGTKERIIAAHKYRPSSNAKATRNRKSAFEMEKRIGDYIISEFATIQVTRKGHVYLPRK